MLSLREKLAQGIIETVVATAKIPSKFKSLGNITEDGFCDYDVPEMDKSYMEKDNTRALRMESSTRARKHRKEVRKYRKDSISGHN